MQICVHHSDKPIRPDHAWLASIYDGKERLPMSFVGTTEDEARAKAEHFWLTERNKAAVKEQEKDDAAKAKAERMKTWWAAKKGTPEATDRDS